MSTGDIIAIVPFVLIGAYLLVRAFLCVRCAWRDLNCTDWNTDHWWVE